MIPILLSFLLAAPQEPQRIPAFRTQVIDDQVGDIWAMTIADVNADGRPDILALSWNNPAHVLWYENPSWKRRTLIEKAPKMLVSITPLDADGDGKTELILGAEYIEPLDRTKGGTIWFLERPENPANPWKPGRVIAAEPTLHRIHPLDGRKLVCSALLGRNGRGAALFVLHPPDLPAVEPWVRETISTDLHSIHNTWSVDWDGDGKQEVLAASREGITLFQRTGPGKWTSRRIGEGHRESGRKGSSEVAVGRLPGGGRYVAEIGPHHGWEAAVYTPSGSDATPWKRKVLHINKGGHTVLPADLTGTGVDSLVVGYVGSYSKHPGGPCWYVFHPLDAEGGKWEKKLLDDRNTTGEDGAVADLNGDGKVDIVSSGGRWVKIYWNERP